MKGSGVNLHLPTLPLTTPVRVQLRQSSSGTCRVLRRELDAPRQGPRRPGSVLRTRVMIICQTPFRVSFFGGGTDWPQFYCDHGGAVLGTTIDRHLYHCATRFHSQLFDYSIRLAYRRVECVRALDEIEHRPFREILRHFTITRDIEISLTSDLPAHTGLGTSSTNRQTRD